VCYLSLKHKSLYTGKLQNAHDSVCNASSLICLNSSELYHMQWFSALRLMTDPLSISITCSCDLRARLICFCTGGSGCAPERAGGAEVCRPAAKRLCEWACRRSMQAPENPIRSQRHLLPWLRPLLAVLPRATSFSLSTLSFS